MTLSMPIRPIIKLLFLGFLFIPSIQGFTQTRTIINTEKSAPDPNKGLHGSVNVTGSGAKGNIDLINLNGKGMLGYRQPDKWLRLLGGSTYFEQDGIKYIDNHYGQLRFSRFFGSEKRWQTYHFAQFQSNFTLILKERGIIGSGIRRSFPFQDTGHFDIGGGVMWEYESLDPERLEPEESTVHRTWRFTSVLIFRRALGEKVTFLNTTYVQPKVVDPGDIRALEELSLLTQLTERFQFDVTFYWRTDTKPPEVIVPSDLGIDFGVLLEL